MVKVTNKQCNQAKDQDILAGNRKGERNWNNVFESCMHLRDATQASLAQGHFPIVFGGDHSQALGSINGLKAVYPGAKLLWVDAHVDVNTP